MFLAGLGCVAPLKLTVANSTHAPIGLHLDRDGSTLGWQDKVVAIAPGKSKTVMAYKVLNEGRITIMARGCQFQYEPPPASDLPTKIKWPRVTDVNVLSGSNADPELVPGVGGFDAEGRRQLKRLDGVRIRPASKTCG